MAERVLSYWFTALMITHHMDQNRKKKEIGAQRYWIEGVERKF